MGAPGWVVHCTPAPPPRGGRCKWGVGEVLGVQGGGGEAVMPHYSFPVCSYMWRVAERLWREMEGVVGVQEGVGGARALHPPEQLLATNQVSTKHIQIRLYYTYQCSVWEPLPGFIL